MKEIGAVKKVGLCMNTTRSSEQNMGCEQNRDCEEQSRGCDRTNTSRGYSCEQNRGCSNSTYFVHRYYFVRVKMDKIGNLLPRTRWLFSISM